MENVYGLIGASLKHSFSRNYFTEKFKNENRVNCHYELFELPDISQFPALISGQHALRGLNVTIPYKEAVMPYLDRLDASAEKVGAVNVIQIADNGIKTGYNSDYFGFRESLEKWLGKEISQIKALVLGTGGAAKAVKSALADLNIGYLQVSRKTSPQAISYENLRDHYILSRYPLVINTTPLGMFPNNGQAPDLDYDEITSGHYLYDLVYNPTKTLFMKKGLEKGAKVKNGLEMLHLQAEKSWEIWNS